VGRQKLPGRIQYGTVAPSGQQSAARSGAIPDLYAANLQSSAPRNDEQRRRFLGWAGINSLTTYLTTPHTEEEIARTIPDVTVKRMVTVSESTDVRQTKALKSHVIGHLAKGDRVYLEVYTPRGKAWVEDNMQWGTIPFGKSGMALGYVPFSALSLGEP
jgi:hypothetical protein